jgi:hypothetical protein
MAVLSEWIIRVEIGLAYLRRLRMPGFFLSGLTDAFGRFGPIERPQYPHAISCLQADLFTSNRFDLKPFAERCLYLP